MLESILENITFTIPFKPSEEVDEILSEEKYQPYYEEGENGRLHQVVPEEYQEARKKYNEEKENWNPESSNLMSFLKNDMTQENICEKENGKN